MNRFTLVGIITLFISLIAMPLPTLAQQSGLIEDKTIKVVAFEELKYPVLALTARVQGLVVIKAELDADGKVVDTDVISGNELLIPDAATNIKKWRFQPSTQKSALVVYEFVLEDECLKPDTFALKGRNLAVVTGHRLPIR